MGDAEAVAETVIPPTYLAYLQGGAADEITLRWNQEKFREIQLNSKILTELGDLDTSLNVLGCEMPCPVLFAPTASNRLFHDEGETAVARGAHETGTTYVLSTTSNTSVEEVASLTQSPLWFQLYIQADIAAAKDLIRRAEAAGARVLCITVDNPVPGPRNRQERAHYRHPAELPLPHFVNRRFDRRELPVDHVTPKRLLWRDIEELISHARIPVVLKGIMNPQDARIALSTGAAGIIVSNHGGRNLDTLPATIEVLPSIADAVGEQVPVLMDGGIRRGTDIVKAMALGAKAVLIGRPYLYGLAAGGAKGVAHIQRLLRRELRMAMAFLGCANLAAIGPNHVRFPNR